MNYMLLIYLDEQAPQMDEAGAKKCGGLAERLGASGHWIAGGILQPTPTATSLRVRQGRRLVTDGPFAETREQLAGYMLIEAKDLDEALEIASQHPVAEFGTVEVRPLREIPVVEVAGRS
ncbi:YciI family protein [Fimbriimonas ginsengisoli]|uniref:YCII-like protein n=1 Tax=Fimbriimonas ginsengisoli Gsoil 348 TaxID=661478 RepID=A0A068NY81_FIMGI|nr:YciI family protein [Fimbriimonas ginsengisoli]AIE87915.1 YCII-like protein [Fimbriimonas ginsengisoli Gsoil 348]